MGEYAIRKSDNVEIKIGTCEEMYYLRFEDRFAVTHKPGNVDPVADAGELRFRLPFPDEDDLKPGEYQDYNRGLRLYRKNDKPDYYDHERKPVFGYSDFTNVPDNDPGRIQLHHESGLLLSVVCHHGAKLPEAGTEISTSWNGKSWSAELSMLRGVKREDGTIRVFPVVKCRHCHHQWRFNWADIWEYLTPEWQDRFREYAALEVLDHDAAAKAGS